MRTYRVTESKEYRFDCKSLTTSDLTLATETAKAWAPECHQVEVKQIFNSKPNVRILCYFKGELLPVN